MAFPWCNAALSFLPISTRSRFDRLASSWALVLHGHAALRSRCRTWAARAGDDQLTGRASRVPGAQ
jgi:hypothetical protein